MRKALQAIAIAAVLVVFGVGVYRGGQVEAAVSAAPIPQSSGTFTATLDFTGGSDGTGTVQYRTLGKFACLLFPLITGTPTAAAGGTVTGLPTALRPDADPGDGNTQVTWMINVVENSVFATGRLTWTSSSNYFAIYPSATASTWAAGSANLRPTQICYLTL